MRDKIKSYYSIHHWEFIVLQPRIFLSPIIAVYADYFFRTIAFYRIFEFEMSGLVRENVALRVSNEVVPDGFGIKVSYLYVQLLKLYNNSGLSIASTSTLSPWNIQQSSGVINIHNLENYNT